MRSLGELMSAVALGDRRAVERHASALRRLDDRVHAEDEAESDYTRPSMAPAWRRGPVLVPPEVTEEDEDLGDDDVEVMFAPMAQDTTEIEVGRGVDVAPEPEREPEPQSEPQSEPRSEPQAEAEPEPEPIGGEDPGPEFEPGFSGGETHR
jgi:hypothetical protein